MLEFNSLTKSFGEISVLRGVSFKVERGRSVGFLGSNGAGKTTTMRTVFGLVRPDVGSAMWNDKSIDMQTRLRFGYMPEQRGLYAGMRVKEQLVYIARLHGLSKKTATGAAAEWLERLGIADRASDKLEKLSHGNQQRVQLAAALLHEPDLLVLDEPFSGLDPTGVDNMKEILAQETKRGAAVMFSSHQLELVEDVCDDIAILHEGVIARNGDIAAEKAASKVRRVEVAGPPNNGWARIAPGVTEHDFNEISGTHEFLIRDDVTASQFLAAATAAGQVDLFTYTPPSLEDLFRETVG